MTTKIKWRLAERPTPSEISLLVEKDLLTKDEAREILFNKETDEDRDKKSLESEVKFLRELVEKLSNKTQIIETIRTIEKPYYTQPWYQPYYYWYANGTSVAGSGLTYCSATDGTTLTSGTGSTNLAYFSSGASGGFSDIKTF